VRASSGEGGTLLKKVAVRGEAMEAAWGRGTAASRAAHATGGVGREHSVAHDSVQYSVCVTASKSWCGSRALPSCCRSCPQAASGAASLGAPARSASTVWRRGHEGRKGSAAGERAATLRKIVGVGAAAFLLVKMGTGVRVRTMADEDV
jgi:hypothetical protein